MFLVVGVQSKTGMREEIFPVSDSISIEKTKSKQKSQAFKMASVKSSEPKYVAYAFFQPK